MADVIVKVKLEGIDKFATVWGPPETPPDFHLPDGCIDYDAEDRWYAAHPQDRSITGIEFEVADIKIVQACIKELEDAKKVLETLNPPKTRRK